MDNCNLEKYIVNNSAEGFAICNSKYSFDRELMELVIQEYNPSFLNLLGVNLNTIFDKFVLRLLKNQISDKFVIKFGSQKLYSDKLLKWLEIKIEWINEELCGIILLDISKDKALKEVMSAAIIVRREEKKLIRSQMIAQVGSWEFDFDKGIVLGSEEAFKIYGISKIAPPITIELVQKIVAIEDRKKMDIAMIKLIENNEKYDMAFKIKKFDSGETRYLRAIAEKETENENKVVGVIIDVTIEKENQIKLRNNNEELSSLYEQIAASEEELRQQLDEIYNHKKLLELSEERYKTLIDNSDDIIYSCDQYGTFTAVNNKFLQVMKFRESQVIGKKMIEILEDKSRAIQWEENIQWVLKSGEVLRVENHSKNDLIYGVTLIPILDYKKNIVGVMGTNHDITLDKRHDKMIRKMAYYDELTGLANRAYFTKKLKTALMEREVIKKGAILFIDMDNFKRINDTLGHALGDEFLKEASIRLRSCLNDKDCLARISGDEFAVLLEDVNEVDTIIPMLDNIIAIFNKPFIIGTSHFDMTLSIGVAAFPKDGDNVDDLLSSSDTAMYKAKERGKNCYQFYDIGMKEELFRKLNIEIKLKRAIKNDEFIIYYQPQYDKKKCIRGIEALIRWNSPELGFLNPVEFITIAEETGLIMSIGEIVLNKSCKFGNYINKTYNNKFITAVNISPVQLRQQNFYDSVVNAIKLSGINPNCLELEVTENVFIDDFELALNALKQLKKLGIRIALDDFGTGFSSLSYLKKLPINLLKIDKSFIDEIKDSTPQNDLTEPIISLVHKLNIETLAEGVEEKVQLDYLTKVGCDNFQGFYLSKPVTKEEVEELIKKATVTLKY